MTEKDLIHAVKTALSCSEAAAKEAVRVLFRTIADEIALNPEGVRLPELGTLRRAAREPRQGRNVRTGQTIEVPARYAVTFSAGKPLKRRLAELAPPADMEGLLRRLARLRQGALDPDGDVAFLLREYDRRGAELLEASSREVERRCAAEDALRVVLARLDDTCATGWVAQPNRPAWEHYDGGLCDFIKQALANG